MNEYRQKLLESINVTLQEEQIFEISWSTISLGAQLNEEFIREFKNKLDWSIISQKQHLSDKFIIEFKDRINWVSYFSFNEPSFYMMKRFIYKTDFRSISDFNTNHLTDNQKISIERMLAVKNIFKNKKTI